MRIGRILLASGQVAYARLETTDHPTAHLFSDAPWAGGIETGTSLPFDESALCVPCVPSKVLCVGRNYAAHAKELGHDVPKEPLLFLKPSSALLDPGGVVVLPPESTRVEHEVELGVVIGERCRHVSQADALSFVYGYTVTGDITARDLQRSDGQWSRAKGFDTFCPAGPWIETELDPSDVRIQCRVNDQARQDGTSSSMIFPVAELIAYMSRMMTLEPGDLLLTGTPEGVGPLLDGDRLEMEIAGIGVLRCQIRTP